MKKLTLPAFCIALALFFACQHELTTDRNSTGTLLKSAGGNCLPVAVSGRYIPDSAANQTNYLTVHVTITTIGDYLISTGVTNGYSFKASGMFSHTGTDSVRLACTGKPLVAGTDRFTIRFQNSICEVLVPVVADTVATAAFSLQGSPGNCIDDTVKGYYIQGIPLDTMNNVGIRVNVSIAGRYSVRTDTVNGYSFTAAGVFRNTGLQTVTLAGTGSPVEPGIDQFKVATPLNSCNFTNTVVRPVPVANQDYFPLTEGSSWSYKTGRLAADTMLRFIKGDTVINNLKYSRMNEATQYRSSQYLFNLNIYDYTEFGAVEKYTSSFAYATVITGLLPFLKEHLATGQSWESAEFKGVANFGQTLFNKYYYRCLSNNAAITINGSGYINVYIIGMYPQIRSEGNSYGSTSEIYYNYYAKGIGLIYVRKVTNGFEQVAMEIKSWHVN